MFRFAASAAVCLLALVIGCQPVSPPADETAEPAEASSPPVGTPRTNWEPEKAQYPRSAESLTTTEDVVKAAQDGDQPNILVSWGDDIGQSNISAYTMGLVGYRTPNIDRVAREGMIFTDHYGEQSCTAGRSTFITGQSAFRTGLSKVGMPGADMGLSAKDPTIAEMLKPLGYSTGQFGKNHLGDKDEFLPTNHGFDEFFGNLYHLNAEEEP
ncbi:MAG TPA: sulfatase-like hydrolase/transferase, partial [Polyangiales bacterium]|nr:sulfatase-like hydrolase/transferase [Polyangiales bacterium]